MDEGGEGDWLAVRNTAGVITGVEAMSAKKASEYYERFFAEELDPDYPAKLNQEGPRDLAKDIAETGEDIQEGAVVTSTAKTTKIIMQIGTAID